jgi:hypothetical protein
MKELNRALLVFVFLLFLGSAVSFPIRAQVINNYYKNVMDKIPADSSTSDYLNGLAKTDKPQLSLAENAELIGLDLVISLVCLLLALAIPMSKCVNFKSFFWFFLGLNIFWLISQLIMRGGWMTMNYFVLRLQPDYLAGITQAFYYISIFLGLGIFNWLLARSFGTGFLGSLKIMIVSSLIYFLLTGVILTAIPSQNYYVSLAKNNLGFTRSLSAYLWDVKDIAGGKSVNFSLRFRTFHL